MDIGFDAPTVWAAIVRTLVGLATALGVAAGGTPGAHGAPSRVQFDSCPTAPQARTESLRRQPELMQAAKGAMTRLPTVYAHVAEGYPFRVQLLGGFRLIERDYVRSAHNPADPKRFFTLATRFCGKAVARNSWAFRVNFPAAGSILSAGYVVFVVRAGPSWRLYGSVALN